MLRLNKQRRHRRWSWTRSQNDTSKCFEDWKKRLHKCIISGGDYFEREKIDIYDKLNNFWKNTKFAILFEQAMYIWLGYEYRWELLVMSAFIYIKHNQRSNIRFEVGTSRQVNLMPWSWTWPTAPTLASQSNRLITTLLCWWLNVKDLAQGANFALWTKVTSRIMGRWATI